MENAKNSHIDQALQYSNTPILTGTFGDKPYGRGN
jgi:hypothetical protein